MEGLGIKEVTFYVNVTGRVLIFNSLEDAVNFARMERVKGNINIEISSTTTYYGW